MRVVTRLPKNDRVSFRELKRDKRKWEQTLQELSEYLWVNLEDAFSSRRAWEGMLQEVLRLYEAVPKVDRREFPIIDAPNLVVQLASIATDTIYSQKLDLLFSMDPPVTCRPTPNGDEEGSTILQKWVNHSAERRWKIRSGAEDTDLDTTQIGTGVYYIPHEQRLRKHRTFEVRQSSARVRGFPIEDFIIPGGSYGDLQEMEWVAARFWLTDRQFADRAELEGWETEGAECTPVKDRIRTAREALGRSRSSHSGKHRKADLYEVIEFYCSYDIDGDGVEEDLYVVFDRTSRTILKVAFNPFDTRPFEYAVYQRRAHLFYGIGVPEMLRMEQDAATEILNYWILNMLLVNSRVIVAPKHVLAEGEQIWPSKILNARDADQIQMLQMADVYPSGPVALSTILSLSERRVGINELSTPRPSQIMGSRTPGITALTLAQASNKRFAHAFDSARLALGRAVMQCVLREGEQLRRGNQDLKREMERVLGIADALKLERLLKDQNFDEQVEVTMTASSASINREADKQNLLLLIDRMGVYYQRILELTQLAEQLPPGSKTREVALAIAEKGTKLVEKALENWDQIKDPAAYLVGMDNELDSQVGRGAQGELGTLGGILGTLAGGGAGMPAIPQEPPA